MFLEEILKEREERILRRVIEKTKELKKLEDQSYRLLRLCREVLKKMENSWRI